MPAETHRHAEAVTAADVIDLLCAVTGAEDIEVGSILRDIGFVDELDVFSFWDAVVEEFAERSLSNPDVSELLEAVTVRDLISAVVRLLDASSRMARP